MGEDESEIESRAHRSVQTVGIYSEKPVCLQREVEGFSYFIFYSCERVEGEEGLFVEDCIAFRKPVVLVAFEHVEGCLHSASDGGTDVWIYLSDLPVPVAEGSCPEYLVVAAVDDAFVESHVGEISFESCPEVLREVYLGASADTERGAGRVVSVRIVASAQIAGMYHHSSRESFYHFLVLCRAAEADGQHQGCNHCPYIHGAKIVKYNNGMQPLSVASRRSFSMWRMFFRNGFLLLKLLKTRA